MLEQRRERTVYATLAVLAVAFVAAVMVSNSFLAGLRIDLTEDKLYTLSPGTVDLLGGIEEPINLYFFFSDRETADVQYLRAYATRVREMLEEFAADSNGLLNLQTVDPVPFSEDEDRAALYGLQNLNQLGESVYFGLAATNSVGDQGIIDFFDPNKEPSLEYDLARLVYSLAHPQKTVVGLLSGVPMAGGFNPQTQQPSEPWTIYQQARQLFDVRSLPSSFSDVDDDIGVLWIVHPQNLDDQTLYAIDQFVLRGGRALIFVDPYAEIASAPGGPGGLGNISSSTLEPLFSAWGLEFTADQVVTDNVYALSVTGISSRPVRHIGLLGLGDDAINRSDVVTSGLDSVNLGDAGELMPADDAKAEFTALLTSSTETALLPSLRFQFLQNPDDLLDDFVSSGKQRVLAARLSGTLETAYPDGPPEGSSADAAAHLTQTDDGNVIVVADVDVLSDRLWVQHQRSLFGQQIATAFANNGDLLTNSIANLSGSADLIGLKSRASFARPFDTVEELRRNADAKFRQTEQQLQAQLAETEKRLSELQTSRDDSSSVLMSPEQQDELHRFQEEQLKIRGELRAVQRDLDKSIEQLGVTLKIINIAAVPLALTVFALAVVFFRRKRSKS